MELRTYKSMPLDDQMELMNQLAEWRGVAESGCQDAIEAMRKNDDFASGDQWDKSLKAQLEEQGKFVATIPLIRPQVNQLVGNVVANPKDITVLNVHGGMKAIADLKSAQLKHALEANDAPGKMVHWFQRGVVTNRAFLAWFADYSRDPVWGNLTIRLLPEMDCLWDPTCKSYDFNGTTGGGDAAKFFFFDEWVDQSWAETRWPEATANFSTAGGGSMFGRLYHGVTQFLYGVVGRSTERNSSRSQLAEADYSATRYRLQHCWWLEYVDAWYWYDTQRSQLDPLILTERRDIALAKRATELHPDAYRMVRSTARVMHHTLSIGDQFLEDWVDEFSLAKANLTAYPVVPYYPSHAWGRAAGIVEDMIGPQETLNWLRSIFINTAKLGPNSGWIIGQDIDGYADYLKKHSGEAGQVIDRSKCGGYLERINPLAPDIAIQAAAGESKLELREVSNVRTEAPEQDTQELSGRAILAKQANAQTGVAPCLANFDWSMRIFGKVGNDIITCSGVYSDDEIKAIVEDGRLLDEKLLWEARQVVCASLGIELPQEPELPNPALFAPQQQTQDPNALAVPGPQPISVSLRMELQGMYVRERQNYEQLMAAIDEQAKPMAIQALIDASRNPIAGTYQCTVSLSPYSATSRLAQMASLTDTNQLLIASGAQPLPERDIIEASDLPQKERLLRERGYA